MHFSSSLNRETAALPLIIDTIRLNIEFKKVNPVVQSASSKKNARAHLILARQKFLFFTILLNIKSCLDHCLACRFPILLLPLGIIRFIFSLSFGKSSSSTHCNISELTIQYSSFSPLTQNLLELDRLISHVKTSIILQYMLKHIDKDSNTL